MADAFSFLVRKFLLFDSAALRYILRLVDGKPLDSPLHPYIAINPELLFARNIFSPFRGEPASN